MKNNYVNGLGCTWEPVRTRGLGNLGNLGQVVTPTTVAAGTTAFKWLVGSVLATAGATLVGEMLGGPDTEDSWKDRSVFNDRMAAMQTGFQLVQCEVGGAQEAFGCAQDGRCLCPSNTRPKCTLPQHKLVEWRALRNGFSAFYAEVGGADWLGSDWLVRDPSDADVTQARDYARKLVKFYVNLPSVCPGYSAPIALDTIVAPERGSTAQAVAQRAAQIAVDEPGWVKGLRYATIGVGIIGIIWVGTVVKDAFRKR